jgi:hypothetical protein
MSAWFRRPPYFGTLLVAAGLACAGCGSSEGGVQLSGAVTYQGQPVTAGEIVFTPKSGDQPSAAGKIEEGRFQCQVPAGPNIVQITAYREVPGKFDTSNPGETNPVIEMYIPPEYNSDSKLEVTVDGSNPTVDFELGSS